MSFGKTSGNEALTYHQSDLYMEHYWTHGSLSQLDRYYVMIDK